MKTLFSDCDPTVADDRTLPTNAFLIEYLQDGMTFDVVMSGKKSEIFDWYWDRYRHDLKNITQCEVELTQNFITFLRNDFIMDYKPYSPKWHRKRYLKEALDKYLDDCVENDIIMDDILSIICERQDRAHAEYHKLEDLELKLRD